MGYVYSGNADGWFRLPERDRQVEKTTALVRRSALIMPVNVPKFVEKAHTRGADAIVLDLEDSVAPAAKAAARDFVREAISLAGRGGADVLVRINKPFDLALADLDAAVWPGLSGIVFPKVESPIEVHVLDALLTERERNRGLRPGSVQVALFVESALGLQYLAEIACASPRSVTLGLGAEDFTRDLGVEPTPDGAEQAYARGKVLAAARLSGLQPQGLLSTLADYSDLESLRGSVVAARKLGFRGASCIHPAQVPVLNQYFSPDPGELAHARRVIEAYEMAEAAGRAAVSLDGKMIDIPIVERARTLVARAAAIELLEERKRAALERLAD